MAYRRHMGSGGRKERAERPSSYHDINEVAESHGEEQASSRGEPNNVHKRLKALQGFQSTESDMRTDEEEDLPFQKDERTHYLINDSQLINKSIDDDSFN